MCSLYVYVCVHICKCIYVCVYRGEVRITHRISSRQNRGFRERCDTYRQMVHDVGSNHQTPVRTQIILTQQI
jgi:hypothetical protein